MCLLRMQRNVNSGNDASLQEREASELACLGDGQWWLKERREGLEGRLWPDSLESSSPQKQFMLGPGESCPLVLKMAYLG